MAPKSPWPTILLASAITAPVAVFASSATQPSTTSPTPSSKAQSQPAPFPPADKPATDAFKVPTAFAPTPSGADSATALPVVPLGGLPGLKGEIVPADAGKGGALPVPAQSKDSGTPKPEVASREEKPNAAAGAGATCPAFPEAEVSKSDPTPPLQVALVPAAAVQEPETSPQGTGTGSGGTPSAGSPGTLASDTGKGTDTPAATNALTLPEVNKIVPTDTDATVAVQTLFLDRLAAAPGVKGGGMVDAQNDKALTKFLKDLQVLRQKGYVPFSVTSCRVAAGADGIEGVRSELWLYLPSGGKITPTSKGGGGILKQFLNRLKVK